MRITGERATILNDISISGDYRWEQANFEDRSSRLNGGNSDNGGLARVNWNEAWNYWNNGSFRPLEVL